MALTAEIPKSFPDLHVLINAHKVVGLHGVFAVTLQRETKVLSQRWLQHSLKFWVGLGLWGDPELQQFILI